jgi:hypothetical protein
VVFKIAGKILSSQAMTSTPRDGRNSNLSPIGNLGRSGIIDKKGEVI